MSIDANPATFGQRIRDRRDELGLSTRQLGERVGVSHTMIRLWEADEHAPQGKNVQRLAHGLEEPAVRVIEWLPYSPIYGYDPDDGTNGEDRLTLLHLARVLLFPRHTLRPSRTVVHASA